MNPASVVNLCIKPIETRYKGYRFRSRLEARWAVFFDALGIRFEYEQQGFKLKDGSFYLPDFYLPDQDTYVEIKPAIDYNPRNIYMAGKFSTEWRGIIAPDFPKWREGEINHLPGFHYYVGPYPAGNGEGSGHANYTADCTHGMKSYGEDEVDVHIPDTEFSPVDVFSACLSQIGDCDTLFAWIDSFDCYGTLAEIGYARALNKEIFISIDENLTIPKAQFYTGRHDVLQSNDLWFVELMANKSFRARSPDVAFNHLLVNIPGAFDKIQKIGGMLIAGNPHPGEYRVYKGWKQGEIYARSNYKDKLIIDVGYWQTNEVKSALLKARSARFEHGEQP